MVGSAQPGVSQVQLGSDEQRTAVAYWPQEGGGGLQVQVPQPFASFWYPFSQKLAQNTTGQGGLHLQMSQPLSSWASPFGQLSLQASGSHITGAHLQTSQPFPSLANPPGQKRSHITGWHLGGSGGQRRMVQPQVPSFLRWQEGPETEPSQHL